MKKFLFGLMMTVLLPSFMNSCSDDDEEESLANDIQSDSTNAVKTMLNGEFVVFTKVTVNGVDKTLLETGCPTRVTFSWENDSLSFSIPEMKIGNMPFAISFKANCEVKKLNSWEADEHAGGNGSWFKFEGNYGNVSTGNGLQPNGSSIKGYFNPESKIIEFVIDYNVMNVRTVCERQTLDVKKERVYADELAKYEKELAEAKKENGLDLSTPTSPSASNGDDASDNVPDEPAQIISFEATKGMLSGDFVISTDVKVGGNLMAEGVATPFNFSWSGDVMTIKITDLQFGSMPFAVNFSGECSRVDLTEDDLAIYSSAWYKFEGKNGLVSANPETSLVSSNSAVGVCYFNPITREIAMSLDFNTAGASAECAKQKINF